MAIVEVENTMNQGWFDPITPEYFENDHQTFYQYNFIVPKAVMDTTEFRQQEGTIYWLEFCMSVEDPLNTAWGWKSSLDHWEDVAVYRGPGPETWLPLVDPVYGDSLDLAFVISNEEYVPAVSPWGLIVMAVLVVSATGLMVHRRARRARA